MKVWLYVVSEKMKRKGEPAEETNKGQSWRWRDDQESVASWKSWDDSALRGESSHIFTFCLSSRNIRTGRLLLGS